MNRKTLFVAGCVALAGALGVTAAVVASDDEPVEFDLHCTLTDRDVACVGQLPEVVPPSSTTPPTSSPPSTAAPTTNSSTTSSTTSTTAPTTSSSTTTTTSTVPPPTTTQPTTTTTVAPTTTTTVPPPQSGFSENFSSPASVNRFEQGFSVVDNDGGPNTQGRCRSHANPAWQCTANLDPANLPDHVGHVETWSGDHNAACGNPTTQRTVDIRNKPSLFWYCAPGGEPGLGHFMSSLHTTGYGIAWFAPLGYQRDVRQVCFDMNLTDLAGGEWAQVVVVPRADVERTNGDLGFTGPGFQDNNGPTTGVHPGSNTVGIKIFRGSAQVWRGSQFVGNATPTLPFYRDRAARFRHCFGELGGTQQRPDGSTINFGSVNLPDGDVRIVFQSDVYDSDKHNEDQAHLPRDSANDPSTWHWDNITVTGP